MAEIVVAIFIATYLGMAAGQVPGLKLDRSGIALIGAIALIAVDAVTPTQAAGVRLSFIAHAQAGVPITLFSTAAATGWLLALRLIPF